MLFIVVRAAVYATLFISLVLILLPRWVVRAAGGVLNEPTPATTVAGGSLFLLGAIIVVACVVSFALLGRGTPAPFDPPRLLVGRGPYNYVRNPMYLGAFIALAGAAVYYRSLILALFAAGFLFVTQLFVVLYEEPVLARKFGDEYRAYLASVPRWIPRFGTKPGGNEPLPPWLS